MAIGRLPKMEGPAAIVSQVVEEMLSELKWSRAPTGFISPSSLAKGCIHYLARELLGMPREDFDTRVKKILEVGTAGHARIPRYFSKITMAREVPFVDYEYRIKGKCDAIIYIPPTMDLVNSGFYVVEIKTTSSSEFEQIMEAGEPKEEHVSQCHIYIWGITRYYQNFPIKGGIIYYENRDSLVHYLFNVEYDEERMKKLLNQVKEVWKYVEEKRLPEPNVPVGHWACEYCPYKFSCDVGLKTMELKKNTTPDWVIAKAIAKRIVLKKRSQVNT